MLPHILHSTTRAVAVVQNQSHTLRNVLQLQSSGPSSGSGSNWGNGPGPGGAKYNAGSRFYSGYNSAGRAVTQANAVTSHDGATSQTDENNEEYTQRRPVLATRPPKRQRMRSSSVSMGVSGRTERGEKMGVLKTVQLHTQQKHTFATVETLASAKEKLLAESIESVSGPLLVRRNSTSAPLSPLLSSSAVDILPEDVHVAPKSPAPPMSPKSPAPAPSTPSGSSTQSELSALATKLERLPDYKAVMSYVRKMLQKNEISVAEFNAALQALVRTRPPGHPLTEVVKLYNTMLDRSVVPNIQTYESLMAALLNRDQEVHRVIMSLEMRVKRAPLVGRLEAATLESDQDRIKQLKEEDNFPSALSLFESALAIGARDQIPYSIYHRLLVSCANHSDVNAAIHIFAHLEAVKDMKIGPQVYQSLILTFANSNKIQEAEHIFETFLDASATGRLRQRTTRYLEHTRRSQIMVWNTMIEAYFRAGMPDKAIELVERIMNSTSSDEFLPQDTPVASSSTFATVIAGFILSGDTQSALSWFNKLLEQEHTPADPYETLGGKAMRPNSAAWHMMLDALAAEGNVSELNRLYTIYKASMEDDQLERRDVDHLVIYNANMNNLKKLDAVPALQTLQFLLDDISELEFERSKWTMTVEICKEFVSRGHFETPCRVMGEQVISKAQDYHFNAPNYPLQSLHATVKEFLDHVYQVVTQSPDQGVPAFSSILVLQRIALVLAMPQELKWAPIILHSYGQARSLSLIPYGEMDLHDWNNLLWYAAHFEASMIKGTLGDIAIPPNFAFKGISTLLRDVSDQGIDFDQLMPDTQRMTLSVLETLYGIRGRQELLERLRPSYHEAANADEKLKYETLRTALDGLRSPNSEPLSDAPSSSSPFSSESSPPSSAEENNDYSNLRFDRYHSQAVMKAIRGDGQKPVEVNIQQAYRIFQDGLLKGVVPHTGTISSLIEQLGRMNDLEKVVELYSIAQRAIERLPATKQQAAWVGIENSMIIALGHSDRLDAAHTHRLRILEHGGCPSADAYGVLIQHVKDTTDDASAALALFSEAIERGVKPNLYLYNNIISKLSKARKADYALELFHQMKASEIHPSSITYGAVIGACARVGDIAAAQALFSEMTQAPDFKPRIPPYNTMMQMYTTTKPDRANVLWYLDEMKRVGVRPSAHTYKLLLDAYGSIEPVDLKAMERTFAELQANENIPLTGAHFASLIYAYGCVSKDLDKAISTFESISSTRNAPPPDAVVFEALINAIVAHKRTELIPVYIDKMSEAGVHMTAYIANFLIKGYANLGSREGMARAREVFESLVDPPTGVAATGNHAPHDPSSSPWMDVMEPVYREPSTWEVMIRAELGAGNRDAAINLLERLRERQYPEAVYNRISGILTDHSVPL